MKLRPRIENFGIGCIASLLATAAAAQEPENPPAQEEAKPPRLTTVFEIDWQGLGLVGSEYKFRQYGTVPEGVFLRRLAYAPPMSARGAFGGFDLRAPGESDQRFEGSLGFDFGRTRARGSIGRHRFFDTTPQLVPVSERETTEGSIRQKLGNGLQAGMDYRMTQQDRYFEAPALPRNQRTEIWSASISGGLGLGNASLFFTDWQYYDRRDVQPDTNARAFGGAISFSPSPSLGLRGSWTKMDISQDGRSDSSVERISMGGSYELNERLNLMFDYDREKRDLPPVLNAWVRDREALRAQVGYRGRGFSAQLGYKNVKSERVRNDQSFVDVPESEHWNGRLRVPIRPDLTLQIRGSDQRIVDGAPMTTLDSRALYFDHRRSLQAQLDWAQESFSFYLVGSYRFLGNEERGVKIRTRGMTAGGAWQWSPELDVFAEYSSDGTDAQSEITVAPALDLFFPASRTVAFGVNWVADERTSVAVTFNSFSTSNANPLGLRDGNVRAEFITATLRRPLPRDFELTFTFAPWRYVDQRLLQMGYQTTIFTLSARKRL